MKNASSQTLAVERRRRIGALLRRRRVLRVGDLGALLHVSEATVRRDLRALDRAGMLCRVYGGAVVPERAAHEPPFDDKAARAVGEKRALAAAAAAMIGPRETVYLDGGSTVLELARLLRERDDLTLVTNSLRAAAEGTAGRARIILVGGVLRGISQTLVGPLTRRLLAGLHVDTACMGTIGVTLAEGMTTTDPDEAYTKELVMQSARRVLLLADSSKIGVVSFARAGSWDRVGVLLTDGGAPPGFVRGLRRRGIDVRLVRKRGRGSNKEHGKDVLPK